MGCCNITVCIMIFAFLRRIALHLMIIIPPAKHSFRGVYCFPPVRDSVILSFRDSGNILSITKVALARFCSNFHHTLTIRHYTFCRKIGAKGSVLQELCHFLFFTVSCLLCEITPPRAFSVSF